MKHYDEAMENLRFRADFCEQTVAKLSSAPKARQRRLPRTLVTAACVCLCAALLFGAVWAASPAFRALFLTNERVEAVEQVRMPEEPGTFTLNDMGPITARYYKLDGKYANYDGVHGFVPVEKDGKTTIYRIDAAGGLIQAEPSRHVQHSVDYAGQHWDIDLTIYEGEDGITLGQTPNGMALNLLDANTWTILVQQSPWLRSVQLNLTTGEITDPLTKLDFTPPEGMRQDDPYPLSLSTEPGGSVALIRCHMADQSYRYYRANLETGEITELGAESYNGQTVFSPSMQLYNGNIYSNAKQQLSVLETDGVWRSLLGEGERSSYGSGRYALVENRTLEQLSLLDLDTGDRLLLPDITGALDLSSHILYSPTRTLLALDRVSLSYDSMNVRTFAVVDPEHLRMVTLERRSDMQEHMFGWVDDTHFLIAGTDEICVYTVNETCADLQP